MNAPDLMIQCNQLGKSFNGRPVLRDLTLSLKRGEVIAVLGPSGSGKSTLIRVVQGLEQADCGELVLNSSLRRPGAIGMIFQNFHLFPHLSVLENITLAPRKVLGQPIQTAEKNGHRLLEQVGLRGHGDKLPHQLSGGEQQRVAIARSLAMNPELLLCDEPTSALDPEKTAEVLEVLQQLVTEQRGKLSLMIVTHEMAFARGVSDQIWFLDQGELVESTPTKEFFSAPQSSRAKAFLTRFS